MNDLTGNTINNRYFIKSIAGQGNMATVYKVWDQHRATHMAMKVLREDLAEDKIFLRRFQREAQTLSRLQHPNIVRFYGIEQEGALAYLLLDFVDGEPLRRKIFETGEPFTEITILEILRPICSALHYAHLEGFVHCDLKPGNVMIDKRKGVYVTDFGISRMTESATATMVGYGTPAYMAPEQIRGKETTAQTDIYAVGIILYEMYSGGERPFTGERASTTGSTGDKVRWEHLNSPPTPLSSYHPHIVPEQEAIVMKCLAKDPEHRFGDALDLIDALEKAIFATIPDMKGAGLMALNFASFPKPASNEAVVTPPEPQEKPTIYEPETSAALIAKAKARRLGIFSGFMAILAIWVVFLAKGNIFPWAQPLLGEPRSGRFPVPVSLTPSQTPLGQTSSDASIKSETDGLLTDLRNADTETPRPSNTPNPNENNGTITPSATKKFQLSETVCNPSAEVLVNANCRSGPDVRFSLLTSFKRGDILKVIGKNEFGNWWYVIIPTTNNKCWISESVLSLSCCESVNTVWAPPTPTEISPTLIQPTSTNTSKPQPTKTQSIKPSATQPPPTQAPQPTNTPKDPYPGPTKPPPTPYP